MSYSDKVLDHFNNPRNVGSLDKSDENVGTGLVGAPACGDVMKLQLKICIDIKSYLFLNGMEIDYQEDLLKSGLVFNAPKASRTCGCGESVTF
jgi:Fe-S cluster assembly iron-binding protein IscA